MQALISLFEQWSGEHPTECLALSGGGSNRRYFRISAPHHACIGAIGEDSRENEAFFSFSIGLLKEGVVVPQLYAISSDRSRYLLQDLGDTTLYTLLYDRRRQGHGFDAIALDLYRHALNDLAHIQRAGRKLDFSLAIPRPDFDRQAILWDLNYFKYFFLKTMYVPFDEQRLEDDFSRFADFLLQADCSYFMYRDFQARNIMVLPTDEKEAPRLAYIDYQGGRRGAAQYDVATLLFSARSDIPTPLRLELLRHYLDHCQIVGDQRRQWIRYFWGYVLVRIMQAMGAYGYRGLFERKDHFIQSIPPAINNLRAVVEAHATELDLDLPELTRVWQAIGRLAPQGATATTEAAVLPGELTVEVGSFSYRQGLPSDTSGNGGGFIFDCRALPNPGRYPQYRAYTGKDRPVVEFLQVEPPVGQFLAHAKSLVGQSVEKYLERRFTHLSVYFGCTGGQHRSVYCAEQMAQWLKNEFACRVVVHHREQDGPSQI